MTTTIVMISLLRKLIKDEKDRLFFVGTVVIAANAGGAWPPIGDVAGTGGSALIIVSVAGVAAMGLEKITFFWYLKKISWLALIGFFSGALIYILQDMILH